MPSGLTSAAKCGLAVLSSGFHADVGCWGLGGRGISTKPSFRCGGAVSKLLELMKNLGSDAALAQEYARDADAVMRRFGLSDEECAALREKDYAAIKRLSGLVDGQFATNHIISAYDD